MTDDAEDQDLDADAYEATNVHDDDDSGGAGDDSPPQLEIAWIAAGVAPGERRALSVRIAESYTGSSIEIPIFVIRGEKAGPTVGITAAVHGDEINGTGTIRRLVADAELGLKAGTLVLVPVVNLMGFEQHSRYLPDRRDLNRSFPGTHDGSLASRMAWHFFEQIIRGCDYVIDLHTAAVRRTNFPNIRANMASREIAGFARAFGAELIVSGRGPEGSLRRAACDVGCKTIILEAGEVWKVEPTVLAYATRGIKNCLKYLEMLDGEPENPAYRVETDSTRWVRAKQSGFLSFHVAPGDIVHAGDAIATCKSLFGTEQYVLTAPRDSIVLGMTTLPTVTPGDAVCHLAFDSSANVNDAEAAVAKLPSDSLHERTRGELATSMVIEDDPNALPSGD